MNEQRIKYLKESRMALLSAMSTVHFADPLYEVINKLIAELEDLINEMSKK